MYDLASDEVTHTYSHASHLLKKKKKKKHKFNNSKDQQLKRGFKFNFMIHLPRKRDTCQQRFTCERKGHFEQKNFTYSCAIRY